MKLIISGRQGGKTFRLLRWLEDNPQGILVVPEYRRAVVLMNQLPAEVAARVVTARALRDNPVLRGSPKVIDDLDDVLVDLFGPIEMATSRPTIDVEQEAPLSNPREA